MLDSLSTRSRSICRIALCVATLPACVRNSAMSEPERQATSTATTPPTGVLLVANQQSADASIIDLKSGIETRIQVGQGPHETAISPDGSLGVVTVYGAQVPGNTLAIIDMREGTIARTIDLGTFRRPHDVSFLPGSNSRVVVTSEAARRIVEVDITTGTVTGQVETGAAGSHMLALAADGRTLFSANLGSNNISQLDLAERAFVRHVTVGPRPEGIAITPDGKEVWVGSNDAGTISVVESAGGSIVATIPGLGMPYRITISPDGKWVAVPDPEGNRVHVLDVMTRRLLGEIAVGGSPRGVEIAPDNRTAFVTLGPEGAVVVVDLNTRLVLGRHTVGTAPDGVGWGRAIGP
jgi:YVTN family beta-propeller protein